MKNNKKISDLLQRPATLSERFHTKTKIKKFPNSVNTDFPESWKKVYFKAYGRFPAISLPHPDLSEVSLKEALINRHSERIFSKIKLSLQSISTILYYSSGIRKPSPEWRANRFYPSGGSRYPLETYVVGLHSELEHSTYHYYIKSHTLENLGSFKKNKLEKLFHQNWVLNAGLLLIIITGVFKRMTDKYGDRGYRHILCETGHMAQNIYLTCSALNLSCCAVGGYIDSGIEDLLDIKSIDESVLYVLAIGNHL